MRTLTVLIMFCAVALYHGAAVAEDAAPAVREEAAPAETRQSDKGVSAATPEPAAQPQAIDAGNTICPVMGVPITKETAVRFEYKGVIYNFCCTHCIGEFKKDPEKYIRIIEEQKRAH